MSTIWLGLITCVFATLFTALGLVIQKHSINMGENLLPLYRRWRWFIGLVLLVCCGGFFDSLVRHATPTLPQLSLPKPNLTQCTQALALAPLSVLSPLSGLSILANVVLASLFLGEQVNPACPRGQLYERKQGSASEGSVREQCRQELTGCPAVQVKRVEVIAFFVMIFGLCFTSAYGAHSSPNYDVQILIDLWWGAWPLLQAADPALQADG